MKEPSDLPVTSALAAPLPRVRVGIGDGWHAELAKCAGGAVLRVGSDAGGAALEIEVALGDAGPIVRTRAAAIEIASEGDLVARCERFRLEARESIDITSEGPLRASARNVEVQATHGSARVRANDDVQLLGEQVLLNCDRSPPMPRWVLPPPATPRPTLPVSDTSGDPELIQSLERGTSPDGAR